MVHTVQNYIGITNVSPTYDVHYFLAHFTLILKNIIKWVNIHENYDPGSKYHLTEFNNVLLSRILLAHSF